VQGHHEYTEVHPILLARIEGPRPGSVERRHRAVVMLDGTVKLLGGQELHLKDGQMMMMDGTIMDGGKPKPMMKPQGMDTGE